MKVLYTLKKSLGRGMMLWLGLGAWSSGLQAEAQSLRQADIHKMQELRRAEKAANAKQPQAVEKKQSPRKAQAAQGVQLYGCIYDSYGDYYSGSPGIYTFNTSDASSFTLVKSGVNVYGGATYGNGSYYAVSYTENASAGTVTFPINLKQYDASTWEQQKYSYGMAFSCIPTDLAYDPTSGVVYGCFCDDANYGTYVTLGRITYGESNTYSCEAIGTLPERMLALTANASGQLYGIGASGKFYTIDKHSGTATVVGSTGVSPQPFFQSATCDYSTGKVYWAAIYGEAWDTGIYEIDPTTGKATLVMDMGENGTYTTDYISGLYIKQDIEISAPPASVSGLSATFADGSLSGTVSFTLPSSDTQGNALSGTLSYTVRANGETVAQGTGQAGESVSQTVSVSPGGLTTITVTVEKDGTSSEPASTTLYVGNDAPCPPTAVKATATGNAVSLTWTAPTENVKGGKIDPNLTTYRITRQPDGTVVASSLAKESFTDNVEQSEPRASYTYDIVAINEGRESEKATSNEVTVDNSLQLPYDNTFDDSESLNGFTILDNNGDGATWGYNSFNESADYSSGDLAADDWLVTPAIYMEKGALYRFSFTASNSYPTERVEAAVGTAPETAALSQIVIEPTDISYTPRVHTLKGEYVAEATGWHYFGIHAISDAGLSAIHVDNLHIDCTPATAPAAVSDFTATPGEKGASEASLAFTAPVRRINGESLNETLSIVVTCDGSELTTLTGVAPGQACTYRHESVADGLHTYSVCARLSDGATGQSLERSCYVGIDAPGPVLNVRAVEDLEKEGLIHVTWDAPAVGLNGGYVDPDGLTYYVSVGTSSNDVSTGNATQYDEQLSISGKQTYQAYSVYAVNATGSGRSVWRTVSAIAGPALKAPCYESFAGVTMKSGPWLTEMTQGEIGEAYWDVQGGMTNEGGAQDVDGGVLVFTARSLEKSCRICSPKVDISSLSQPVLNFYAYFNGTDNNLRVSISADYGEYEELLSVKTDSKSAGWYRYSLPLDKYKGSRFVRAGFDATAIATKSDVVAVDNIAFVDDAECDLMAVSLSAPAELYSGDNGEFSLSLRNNGSQPVAAEGYKVVLYKNGTAVASADGVDVESDGMASITVESAPTVFDPAECEYYARIECEADALPDNNQSSVCTVLVNQFDYPAPSSLTAADGHSVSLSWQAPDLENRKPAAVTDSFDDYTAFDILGFGSWTTVDRDGQNTIRITLSSLFGPLDYAHAGEPMAFQVFNSETAGIPYSSWDPHSGDQMLVCMSNASSGGTTVANDDWLISPQIYDGGQTLTLYAKAGMSGDYVPELMEVLYSTTDAEPDNFVKIGETIEVENVSGWQKYSFDLPEGARYFAIHCVSEDKFALLLDDISYIPADAEPEELVLRGYNVYRDGVKLNSKPVDATAYSDEAAPKQQTSEYHVTAVYDKGESVPSNAAEVTFTAIAAVSGDAVWSVDTLPQMIVVRGAKPGIQLRVYAADGRLVTQRTARSANETFAALPGAYVVTANGQSVKIAVK